MLKKSLFILSCATLLSASTTMCFKKDHFDPDTIETIPLKGGVCGDKLSVEDMKKDGYKVEDIKISNATDGLNYIYIFKKEDRKTEVVIPTSNTFTSEDLKAQLKVIENEKSEKKKNETIKADLESGKKLYESTCKNCHGDGTIRAYNSARPLNDLTLEDMKESIRDYSNGNKDNGMAMIMMPYANATTQKDITAIYHYLKSIK